MAKYGTIITITIIQRKRYPKLSTQTLHSVPGCIFRRALETFSLTWHEFETLVFSLTYKHTENHILFTCFFERRNESVSVLGMFLSTLSLSFVWGINIMCRQLLLLQSLYSIYSVRYVYVHCISRMCCFIWKSQNRTKKIRLWKQNSV